MVVVGLGLTRDDFVRFGSDGRLIQSEDADSERLASPPQPQLPILLGVLTLPIAVPVVFSDPDELPPSASSFSP